MTTAVPEIYDVVDRRTLDILERRRGHSAPRRRGWLVRRMLLASDLLGLTLAFVIAEVVYSHHTQTGVFNAFGEQILFVVALPLWAVAAKLYGLYDRDEERTDHSTADDFAGVFQLLSVGTWVLFAAAYVTQLAHPQVAKLMLFWLIAAAVVPLARSTARAYCRRSVLYLQNTLIVGAGDVGQQIARKFLRHDEYGINLVGFVDDQPKLRRDDLGHLALLGGTEDLPALVELLDIERVVVAFSNESDSDLLYLLRKLNGRGVQIDIVPRFYELVSAAADIHSVEGVAVMGVRPPKLSASSALLKRGVDLAGSFVGLVLFAPMFVAAAIMIKLDSPGPVFFRQTRMGEKGHPFRIWKFRTMSMDAEEQKANILHLNKHAFNGDDVRMFKMPDDPRITRFGKFLRATSIDELPQLFNVVRGEMSLVGPRPLVLDEDQHVRAWARKRVDLKPGMTGLWQVLGRSDIPFDEMVSLDYRYVSTWSLGHDLNLLAKTIPAVLKSRNS